MKIVCLEIHAIHHVYVFASVGCLFYELISYVAI